MIMKKLFVYNPTLIGIIPLTVCNQRDVPILWSIVTLQFNVDNNKHKSRSTPPSMSLLHKQISPAYNTFCYKREKYEWSPHRHLIQVVSEAYITSLNGCKAHKCRVSSELTQQAFPYAPILWLITIFALDLGQLNSFSVYIDSVTMLATFSTWPTRLSHTMRCSIGLSKPSRCTEWKRRVRSSPQLSVIF